MGRRDEDEEVVRLLCPDVYDYSASTRCINFRICASSGKTVIYNCSDLGLRVEIFLICASVAYPVALQWYQSHCCHVIGSGDLHMAICKSV